MKTMKREFSVLKIILCTVLVLFVISMLLPLLWGLSTSLKEYYDYRKNKIGLPSGWPHTWAWKNYGYVLTHYTAPTVTGSGMAINVSMGRQIVNTLLYAGGGGLIITFVPFLMAYLTARYNFALSKVVYGIVLVTMMLPIVGAYPAEIKLLRTLNLYDTMWGSWIQKATFLGMYYLVFYATFKGMDPAFYEAAYMDGASEFTVMAKIIMPLAKNVFFTVFLLKFIEFWNDYQNVLLYIPGWPTLAFGVYTFGNSTDPNLNTEPMRMAGCFMIVIPIIAVFLGFKNRLMGNLTMGGVKG